MSSIFHSNLSFYMTYNNTVQGGFVSFGKLLPVIKIDTFPHSQAARTHKFLLNLSILTFDAQIYDSSTFSYFYEI